MTHPSTWLGGRSVLLLSPHPDDVAYSVGGIVALAAGIADLSMLTVFGRSAWALSADLRLQGVDAVTRTRADENRAYCGLRGITYHALEFGDSSCQGYDEAGEMSADPANDPRTGTVQAAVNARVAALAPDIVLAPAAIGGHIDHRIVAEAARQLDGVRVLFYEDLPYAAWQTLQAIEQTLAASELSPFASVDISGVIDDKIEGMWLYRTQTSVGTIGEMLLHADRLGVGGLRRVERVWI